MEDDELLVLSTARAAENGRRYERGRDLALVHRCCDDGVSLRMDADEDSLRENREFACAHLRRKFDLGHWESRVGGRWVPCPGHNPIDGCERIGPKRDRHRFVPSPPGGVRTSGSASSRSAR